MLTLTPLGNTCWPSVSKDMDTITETLLEDMMIAIVYCCILGTPLYLLYSCKNARTDAEWCVFCIRGAGVSLLCAAN